MSLGAGLLTITAGGCGTAIPGRGGRDRSGAVVSIVRSGRRPMWDSLDSVAASELVSASAAGVVLAGCPWAPATGSIRGGVGFEDGLVS
jgi:hypothetical protein